MAEIQIRPAIATDLARLMQIDHTCTTEYVWQLDLRREPTQIEAAFREVRLPRSVRVEYPRAVEKLPDEWHRTPMFTALLGSEPVGYVRLSDQIVKQAVWITDLIVARDLRRQGLASKLLQAAQAWGAERGLPRAILEMTSKHYPAFRLAQKSGYEFCGYNDLHYETKDIAIFFGRNL
jgi:GNAT superfamily N-acetyltransferase